MPNEVTTTTTCIRCKATTVREGAQKYTTPHAWFYFTLKEQALVHDAHIADHLCPPCGKLVRDTATKLITISDNSIITTERATICNKCNHELSYHSKDICSFAGCSCGTGVYKADTDTCRCGHPRRDHGNTSITVCYFDMCSCTTYRPARRCRCSHVEPVHNQRLYYCEDDNCTCQAYRELDPYITTTLCAKPECGHPKEQHSDESGWCDANDPCVEFVAP